MIRVGYASTYKLSAYLTIIILKNTVRHRVRVCNTVLSQVRGVDCQNFHVATDFTGTCSNSIKIQSQEGPILPAIYFERCASDR